MSHVEHVFQIILSLLALSTTTSSSCTAQTAGLSFDFREGVQGWEADFADFHVDQEPILQLEAELRELPAEIGEGTAYYLHGMNVSDDLFMFLKRRLGPQDGIRPNQSYRLRFIITFASNAPSNCAGIGGPPGEAVTLKAGATTVEPQAIVGEDGFVEMNVDKGNQSAGGPAATVVGNIANGIDCDDVPDLQNPPYVSLRRARWHEQTLTTGQEAELWLLIGTDSGFEGSTGLYYQRIDVQLLPVLDGSQNAQPLNTSLKEAEAVPL